MFSTESEEKMLRLASVSVERERVNGEKNALPRSERERGRTTTGKR